MGDTLANLVWILPRPRLQKRGSSTFYYKGSFPLHFEQRLWRLLGKPEKVLHPFGGMAEIGVRVDINPAVNPDYVGDAHKLPFDNETFDAVFCDPPYSDKQNKQLYNISTPLRYNTWVKEAQRVLKPNGFLVLYHERWLPRPKQCSYWMRIIVLVSQHHRPRIAGIFLKEQREIKEDFIPWEECFK